MTGGDVVCANGYGNESELDSVLQFVVYYMVDFLKSLNFKYDLISREESWSKLNSLRLKDVGRPLLYTKLSASAVGALEVFYLHWARPVIIKIVDDESTVLRRGPVTLRRRVYFIWL